MNLPFVSRRHMDERLESTASSYAKTVGEQASRIALLETMLAQRNASADHEIVRSEARYADLMVSYRQLRLQGYVEAPAAPAVSPEPDPIAVALAHVGRGLPPQIREAQRRQAEEDRKALPVEAVVERILGGHNPLSEFAS